MTQTSPRETLDRNIQQLKDDILVLGSMVEQALLKSVDALKRQDLKLAQRIYDGDIRVNAKRFDIENEALVLIATQQPMAVGALLWWTFVGHLSIGGFDLRPEGCDRIIVPHGANQGRWPQAQGRGIQDPRKRASLPLRQRTLRQRDERSGTLQRAWE